MFRQARWDEPLILEGECPGKEKSPLPKGMGRQSPLKLPYKEEHEIIKHFTRLSQMNYGVDTGLYPLGSCTMKHNPSFNEMLASRPKAKWMHPDEPCDTSQGSLEVMYNLQGMLCELGGVEAVTLQPSAGAQGEFTGMMVIAAYHEDQGNERSEVIVPDSAHGTNPASAAMAGFDVVEIPSKEGRVDLDALSSALSEKTAALMLTNPNTLGLFEKEVLEIEAMVHEAGALLYYDGANLNAIMGKTKPGIMGFDVVHFNLHKTFSTPHGGGGPGSGPIGVKDFLKAYLPVPVVKKNSDGRFAFDYSLEKTIGRVLGTQGNFLVLLRAYAYIVHLGCDGLTEATEKAVLNANYVMNGVKEHITVPYEGWRKHEFVATARKLADEKGIHATDIAKYLLDQGIHAPTIYFPLLVPEALMFEPTESATKKELDHLVEAIREAVENAGESHPENLARARVDETLAARKPILSEKMERER